jgi:hypothetical protein
VHKVRTMGAVHDDCGIQLAHIIDLWDGGFVDFVLGA